MDYKRDDDFVIHIKTPTSCVSQRVSLGEQDAKFRSASCNSKSPKVRRSSNSESYSDSFDDSPIKTMTKKKVIHSLKSKCLKSSMLYRKSTSNVCGASRNFRPNETTQKVLESNQLKISELLSENADCHRQMIEKDSELKTLQNQNKIQERCLKKINSRDADVPNIIARYNSEIHSLQELLRRNKEKLDLSNKGKRDLEIELAKVKAKNEKLNTICEDNQLHEKGDLLKKIHVLNELLETDSKKRIEMERSVELMTKRHNHQMVLEINKYKDLNLSYKDALNEIRDIRGLLKEKTKLLEMQNIYSKMIVKPPHHLTSDIGDDEEHRHKTKSSQPVKSIQREKETKPISRNSHRRLAKSTRLTQSRKTIPATKTLMESQEKTKTVPSATMGQTRMLGSTDGKGNKKALFFGDTPSEISELEERSEKFSDLHEMVRKSMQIRNTEDSERARKNDLLAKLRNIDDNRGTGDQEQGDVTKHEMFISENHVVDDLDVFCTSESEEENSERNSGDSSPGLFIAQGPAGLMGSRRNIDSQRKSDMSNFDFLRFPLNNNSCYGIIGGSRREGPRRPDSSDLSDCEEINID